MYKLLAGAVGVTLLIAVTGWFSYQSGADHMKAKYADAIAKARAKDKDSVKEVIKYREKIKVVYRDRIKTIKQVKDATGCADVKYTDMGFRLHSDNP